MQCIGCSPNSGDGREISLGKRVKHYCRGLRIVDGPSTHDRRLSGLDDVESPTMPPDNRYKGVHVGNPITSQDAKNLIETFQKEKHRLHAKYISSILKQAVKRLKTLPNLNEVSTLSSKQVTICGDLHGKLDDLLVVFHKLALMRSQEDFGTPGPHHTPMTSDEGLLLRFLGLFDFPTTP
ncbi:unnamed protein product [Bemisia tabaci]|uniref:protein-serine/threonine phosphatase n=1 Tax=Bemisia tabaci TaxID=7038 RepID=A0A9P0AEN7_BEMTA|nr:unnamed protein product [Bemisia tabaci]